MRENLGLVKVMNEVYQIVENFTLIVQTGYFEEGTGGGLHDLFSLGPPSRTSVISPNIFSSFTLLRTLVVLSASQSPRPRRRLPRPPTPNSGSKAACF